MLKIIFKFNDEMSTKDKKDVTPQFNTGSALLDQLGEIKTNPKSENQEIQTPVKSGDRAKGFRLRKLKSLFPW